jgi:hypothetical protein
MASGSPGAVVHELVAGSKAALVPGWITTMCVPVQTIAREPSGSGGSGAAGSIAQVRPAGS